MAILTFGLPYLTAQGDPLAQCGLRVVCFFYACKLLDLALTKADPPPVLLQTDAGIVRYMATAVTNRKIWQDHAVYVWLLLTEMRYHCFDIAVVQKDRPAAQRNYIRSVAIPLIEALAAAVLAIIIQLPKLKCFSLLLFLQCVLEGMHIILHPRCRYALFYQPLSASSMRSFWTVHWHAAALPFLQSLAYRPGRRYVGRWLAVLNTFSLSGAWHGWASAVLVDDQHAFLLGLQVLLLFVLFGVVCLAEQLVWGDQQRGMVQRSVAWGVAFIAAGQCFRTLQRHSKIDWLRGEPL